ncbi:MAG: 3-deoxy-manno-octulosonate cytidylyltransferase [Candidatus Cloacimonadota bacterium]|nr:3-deoxy-manno-octulosonate cytidylyltransferase [Candidatus Cloacimonadota bacterium]
MKNTVAIIPARYNSTRLPRKPLRKINNKTLIQTIYKNVEKTGIFSDVIVATDNSRIFDVVKSFGGNVKLTASYHKCGTERVAEIAKKLDADIIINIQGDELFITKEPLNKLIHAFYEPDVSVATLIHPISSYEEIENPNRVKVIFDENDFAIYFSRLPIPYQRIDSNIKFQHYVHIGVYAFRQDALQIFASLPQSKLERAEKLEQLRLIENGIKIKVIETDYRGFPIDTEEDLKKVLELKKNNY